MAREPNRGSSEDMAPSGNRTLDDRTAGVGEGAIRIMIGEDEVVSYDATHLSDQQRRDIASRIIRYADSQTLGLKRSGR